MYILGSPGNENANQSLEAWNSGFYYASTPFSMATVQGQAWHMLTVVGNGTTSTYYVDGSQAGSPLNWVSTANIGQVGGQVGQGASRNLAAGSTTSTFTRLR